jgi:ornithine carbamoyltransferase
MAPDFLTGEEIAESLGSILERAAALKGGRPRTGSDSLDGKSVALIFEQPSTRTRVSFEVGVAELGGTPVVLRSDEMQISRGESLGDVGRVLSRYVHAIAIRSGSHDRVTELAAAADVPVINALTPLHHPCQALADLLTLQERFGELAGLRIAYVGDGNNVARSLALLGAAAGVEVVVSSPPGFELAGDEGAILISDPAEAVAGADAVYTDVWISMAEPDAESKREALAPYRVDEELIAKASDRAIVLHCLPAHPGEEITEGALYGERSAVFDQAENRLHAQKALLEELVE